MPHSDYLVLPKKPSEEGNTFIIGDVHGEIGAFEKVLAQLSPADTLIIAGDLIDRGQDDDGKPASALVLDNIIALNQAPEGTVPKVYAIKGNHEKYFLDMMALLKKDTPIETDDIDRATRFIKNGGSWLFKKHDQSATDTLHLWCAHYAFDSYLDKATPVIETFVNQLLHSPNRFDFVIDKAADYEEYISSLPYILKLNDITDPAWVAHADLPMTDETLNHKIATNERLTVAEVLSVIETRPNAFSSIRSIEPSGRVYCGHNIIDEQPERKIHPTTAVRAATNHINLDGGAYFTKGLLVVNHSQNTIDLVGNNVSSTDMAFLTSAKNEIEAFITPSLQSEYSQSELLSTSGVFNASPKGSNKRALDTAFPKKEKDENTSMDPNSKI